MLFEKELQKHLETYMEYGGFPLSVASLYEAKEDAKKAYLSWIKNEVLKAERSDIIARQIAKVLLETFQTNISWEGISKKIEIKSPKTVAAYIDLLQSIFVVTVLYNIDISSKKIRFGKNKKIYARDPLIIDIFEDWFFLKAANKKSIIAESLVIEHLSRLFPDRVFFWKNGIEIDAIVLENEKLYGIEVKWSENSYRQIPSMRSIPNNFKKYIIVTKKDYGKEPLRVPLAVFLSML